MVQRTPPAAAPPEQAPRFWINPSRPRLHVDRWADSLVEVVRVEGLSEVSINDASMESLDPLLPLADCLEGVALSTPLSDISAISALSRLRGLALSGSAILPDLSRLGTLESVYLERPSREAVSTLRTAPGLERLTLVAAKLMNLEPLAGLSRLRQLELQETPIKTLDGIAILQSLERFVMRQVPIGTVRGIGAARALTSLSLLFVGQLEEIGPLAELESLQGLSLMIPRRLRDLARLGELSRLTKLALLGAVGQDVAWIGELKRLRSLRLENIGKIESIAAIAKLPHLEELTIYGRSTIADGDLSTVLTNPRLRNFVCVNRKHYQPTADEIEQAVNARWAPRTDE